MQCFELSKYSIFLFDSSAKKLHKWNDLSASKQTSQHFSADWEDEAQRSFISLFISQHSDCYSVTSFNGLKQSQKKKKQKKKPKQTSAISSIFVSVHICGKNISQPVFCQWLQRKDYFVWGEGFFFKSSMSYIQINSTHILLLITPHLFSLKYICEFVWNYKFSIWLRINRFRATEGLMVPCQSDWVSLVSSLWHPAKSLISTEAGSNYIQAVKILAPIYLF